VTFLAVASRLVILILAVVIPVATTVVVISK
jgi:hypothetical protein